MSAPASVLEMVAQQQHEPPAGAHIILLAGAAVTALVLLGVRWWRGRRDASADDERPISPDRSTGGTHEAEDE